MSYLIIEPDALYNSSSTARVLSVSSGGLAVKHPALGANGRRFEPRKRSKLFPGINFSAHYIVGGGPR